MSFAPRGLNTFQMSSVSAYRLLATNSVLVRWGRFHLAPGWAVPRGAVCGAADSGARRPQYEYKRRQWVMCLTDLMLFMWLLNCIVALSNGSRRFAGIELRHYASYCASLDPNGDIFWMLSAWFRGLKAKVKLRFRARFAVGAAVG
jgi:hypothetical protein